MVGIEFGSGGTPLRKGFKTVDIRKVEGVDYVCNAWDITDQVEEDSVDHIFSRHFFEHLTFVQAEYTLDAWKKIIKPEGLIEMLLPNMTWHIEQWVTRSNLERAKEGFWGKQREGATETWDLHKSGYDRESLEALLVDEGFVDIDFRRALDKNLHVCFKKKDLQWVDYRNYIS